MVGRDRGQAAVLFLMTMAVMFVVLVGALAILGGRVIDRTRAQSLADAAALASLGADRLTARRIVSDHGGSLVAWLPSVDGTSVTVRVRVGDAIATARASTMP